MCISDKTYAKIITILTAVGAFLILCIFAEVPYLQENELAGMVLSIFCSFCFLFLIIAVMLWKSPWAWSKGYSLIFVAISPVISFFVVDSLNQVNCFSYDIFTGGFNLWAYFAVLSVLLLVTGNMKISLLCFFPLCLLFGFTNHYVSEFRGSPFLPWDILSARTAFSVASHYQFSFGLSEIFPILLTLGMMALTLRIDTKALSFHGIRKQLLGRTAALLFCGIFCGISLFTNIPDKAGIKEFPWNQAGAYRSNGTLMNFLLNTKYLMIAKPEGYSLEKVVEIGEEAAKQTDSSQQEVSGETETNPNIIVIMNESFSDLSVIGDFGVSQDYMPFFRSMEENTIKGYLYVSVHGGSTCNTEFEMLTGDTNGFLPSGSIPYQQYIKSPVPSLVTILEQLGYSNSALHPYYSTGWNRNTVYPLLGFQQFYTLNSWKAPHTIRGYVSDTSNYEKLISLFENKPQDQPIFLFNITMQNHSGYTNPDYESTVSLTGLEGDYPQTEQYLSLIRESDSALEQLIHYFENVEEPTILLFFGDHQPAIESSFYEEVMGKPLEKLSLEELQKRYMTPFVIWANYDIPEQQIDAFSANYLSALLLKTAGLPMPEYQQFLLELSETIPAINANGYLGENGQWYSFDETSPYEDQLNDYRILQYNHLFGKEDRVDSVFSITS
ncbi:MAG: LTA synthase family protein [Massiliimalia sp.]